MLLRQLCCCCGLQNGCLAIVGLGIFWSYVVIRIGAQVMYAPIHDPKIPSSANNSSGVGLVCYGVVQLLACAALFAGTVWHSKGLLVPYIVFAVWSTLGSIAGCVSALGTTTADSHDGYYYLVVVAIWLYKLAVVSARYSELWHSDGAMSMSSAKEKSDEAEALLAYEDDGIE